MRITSTDGSEIKDLEEWRTLAGPRSADQWKNKRSAKELGRAWLPSAQTVVEEWLGQQPALQGLRLEQAWPEHATQFDANPDGPRVHDLLVRGSAEVGRVVLAVEAKADEGFGQPLRAHLAAAERRAAKSPSGLSGTPARVDALVRGFFGAPLDERPNLQVVGYQLFSALAGTLVEAHAHEASIAVLLVHEFVSNEASPQKQANNLEQLRTFVTALGGTLEGDADRLVSDVVAVPGANDRMAPSTPVVFAKLRTRV